MGLESINRVNHKIRRFVCRIIGFDLIPYDRFNKVLLVLGLLFIVTGNTLAESYYVAEAGHSSLQKWLLPDVPYPENNKPTEVRTQLGKKLYFDPRLSGDGNMSCATCHNPLFGWSDGLPLAKGFKSQILGRASPTIVNSAYNTIQMWDGRKVSLEDQAIAPMEAELEMHTDVPKLIEFLNKSKEYKSAFDRAYPGEGINTLTISKAIASFERTIISNDSPFDRWVKGDVNAMSDKQVKGFEVFTDANKGNCTICHMPPNFTDNGFHNIGLTSFGKPEPDMGRFNQRAVKLMRGAFKTPTLRDITLTAPYFHDGSATSLVDVIEHYVKGGEVKTNLSPGIKPLNLNEQEKQELIAFLKALTTRPDAVILPVLPLR